MTTLILNLVLGAAAMAVLFVVFALQPRQTASCGGDCSGCTGDCALEDLSADLLHAPADSPRQETPSSRVRPLPEVSA